MTYRRYYGDMTELNPLILQNSAMIVGYDGFMIFWIFYCSKIHVLPIPPPQVNAINLCEPPVFYQAAVNRNDHACKRVFHVAAVNAR